MFHTIIAGGGPAGILTALRLARQHPADSFALLEKESQRLGLSNVQNYLLFGESPLGWPYNRCWGNLARRWGIW